MKNFFGFDFIVLGGGAAGFFAALRAKELLPHLKVAIIEKSGVLLSKVRISGGGRCNVTHACFDPSLLSKNYPRGEKELIGPFHRFQPRDTIEWFKERGVSLIVEEDGRMFPSTHNSETIIDCFLSEAKRLGVEIFLRQKVGKIEKKDEVFVLEIEGKEPFVSRHLLLATGSHKEGWAFAASLGHTIISAVPSLFTFNVPDSPWKEWSGLVIEKVGLSIPGTSLRQVGPLLITHFGFSGPAALKLSAWAARYFSERKEEIDLMIDFLPDLSLQEVIARFESAKKGAPSKTVLSQNLFGLPKNAWKFFVPGEKRMNDLSTQEIGMVSRHLKGAIYHVKGKTTNKEEFVTCGGVDLKEVHFKTMESKICPNLFFAGEVLNIDGITGGFNFQNAWTTGFIAGSQVSKPL